MKFFTKSSIISKRTIQTFKTITASTFLLLVFMFPAIAGNANSKVREIAIAPKSISSGLDAKTNHNLITPTLNAVAAKFKVSGTIVSAKTLETLVGVQVREKGTSNATVTDVNGAFTLQVASPKAILLISYVGYETQEFPVDNVSQLTIRLTESVKQLDEVVVVGYGSQKRVTVTGAITTISTKDLRQSPTTNLSNALAGRLSGMVVTQYSGGEPGVDQSSVFVRGISTYNTANNAQKPIVIVDGIERDFQYLNPDEVESFSILKDASATAVYGVRGANGVILVTTRRGQLMEKATVTFKATTGISSPIKFPQYLGSADYATLYNEALTNDKSPKTQFTQAAIDNYKIAKGDNSDGLGYNTNLFDYAFKPSMQEDYSLNVQGGTKTAKYFVLLGYMSQNGNYKHTDEGTLPTNAVFKRYNFRSNIDINITDNFYVKLNLGGRIQDRRAPATSAATIVNLANTQPSIYPVILENNANPGNINYTKNHPEGLLFGTTLYRYNMLGELAYSGVQDYYEQHMDGSFVMGHKLDFLTKGLMVEGQISYDNAAGNMIDRSVSRVTDGYRQYGGYATFYPADGADVLMQGGHYQGLYTTPRLSVNNTLNNSLSANFISPTHKTDMQAKFNYNRSFGLHSVSGLLLARKSVTQISNQVQYATQGEALRATYNYADKYLFEINAAYNGSESFAPGHRYGFFPAVSAGWVVSSEKFMKNNPIFDFLKLRGSYGLVGNDQLPGNRFGYMQLYTVNSSTYNFGWGLNEAGNANVYEGALANMDITWEKSKKSNLGIETRMLKNRLSITADLFFEHRYDILTAPTPGLTKMPSAILGQTVPQINLGIVNNHGIDLELGWNDKIGSDFTYYIKPNLTFARNKIMFQNEIDRYSPDGKMITSAYRTGKRIGEQFVYQFDHFIKDQAEADKINSTGYQPWSTQLIPGDVVYKDQNGDGKITDQEDRIAMGNPRTPEIQFGMPVGIAYKGFDLSILFQGATNTSIELTDAAAWDFPTYGQDIIGRVKPVHLNRWTPATAATATYPVLHYGPYTNNKNPNSSLFLMDASYVRLKSLEFGYSLPQSILRKVGFARTRFYVQAINLATWDKLKKFDVDPETNTVGDWYPIQRVISFGVDVTF